MAMTGDASDRVALSDGRTTWVLCIATIAATLPIQHLESCKCSGLAHTAKQRNGVPMTHPRKLSSLTLSAVHRRPARAIMAGNNITHATHEHVIFHTSCYAGSQASHTQPAGGTVGSDASRGAVLDMWQENLAIMAGGSMPGAEAAMTKLGDRLLRERGQVYRVSLASQVHSAK